MNLTISEFRDNLEKVFGMEDNRPDRKIRVMTGEQGLHLLSGAMELEVWSIRLNSTVTKSTPLGIGQHIEITRGLKSNDYDKVNIAKVIIQLRENEFNF